MPDDVAVIDQQQQTDAGATATDAATAVPEAPREPASPRPDFSKAFADFDKVFGQQEAAASGSSGEPKPTVQGDQPPPATSAPASEAATAQDGADDAASSEGEPAQAQPAEAAQDKKPSRTERIHLEYQEKLTAKDQEIQALTEKLHAATGTLSEAEQRDRAAQQQFLDAYGPDDEYERLTLLNNKGLPLAADEYDNLQRWTTTRELSKPFMALADAKAREAQAEARATVERTGQQFAEYLRTQLATRVEKYGLDPETVQKAEYGGLIDHAVTVAERRKDAEYAPKLQERDDRISQIEAQLREAQDMLKGQRIELPRGGHPSEVVVSPRSTYSQRNLTAPLADDWAGAFSSDRASAR